MDTTQETTPYELLPERILWRGPSGSTVELCEDGIFLQAPTLLEQCEVMQLLAIIEQAREALAEGLSWVPRPPTGTEMQRMRYSDQQQQAAKAIVRELAPWEPR